MKENRSSLQHQFLRSLERPLVHVVSQPVSSRHRCDLVDNAHEFALLAEVGNRRKHFRQFWSGLLGGRDPAFRSQALQAFQTASEEVGGGGARLLL